MGALGCLHADRFCRKERDTEQGSVHGHGVMKNTNDAKVIQALRAFGVYGFEAVKLASYLVKRANGDVKVAVELAKSPVKIDGKHVW